MKLTNCEQRSDEWHNIRMGKITGTGLKKLSGTKLSRDNFFYEVLAERLSLESQKEESDLDRGVRLEDTAVEQFEAKAGKIVEKIGFCQREDNQFIANSPDGLINNNGTYSEALEVKCPSSAKHIKYLLEDKIPEEYYHQVLQYFIVNDELQKLFFISYDDRIPNHELWIKEIARKEIEEDIAYYKEQQEKFIEEINEKLEGLINDF